MVLTSYYTVKKQGMNEIEIRHSRFIAQVCRTEKEDEAKRFIEEIKKKNWKATHNCYAYMIGENQEIQKTSDDDGEPSGTAGVPILDVLKKRRLRDVTVVVTRYFGGIKLGAGGLIRAYSHAASAGLTAAEVVERIPYDLWRATIDYHQFGYLENRLRESPYIIKDVHYGEKVAIDVYARQESGSSYADWVTNLTNAQARIEKLCSTYLEKKVIET
ncbi:YigZ family protein [Terrilactibacillus sp. S3-3]|nr:YigZ family protein [Terrilactibacillus sp. S3-3]